MVRVTAIHLDFDNLAHSGDDVVIQHMGYLFRMSKKPLIPKRIKFDAARVSRQPNLLIIHLLHTEPRTSVKKEVAQFCFAPPPSFSGLSVLG